MTPPQAQDAAREGQLVADVRAAALAVSSWQVAATLIAAAGNIYLARQLGSRVFGAYAVSFFVLNLVGISVDFGVHNGLIRRPGRISDRHIKTAFTLAALLTVAAAPVVWLALAPAVARWYGNQDVRLLISLGFVGLALSTTLRPSLSLLEREMRYRTVIGGESLGTLAFYAVAAALAARGHGALALAAGEACRGLAALYFFWRRPFKVGLLIDRGSLREMLRFGAAYSGLVMSWTSLSALNPILVGKLAGLEAVGILRLGESLANQLTLLKRVGERLAYPVLAQLQGRPEAIAGAVAQGQLYQFLLGVLPLSAFTAVSRWLVPLLFGDHWLPVANVLPLSCLALSMSALFALDSSALVTIKRPGEVVRFNLAFAGAQCLTAPYLVWRLGYLGLPVAALLATPTYWLVHRSFRKHFAAPGRAQVGGWFVKSWLITLAAWNMPHWAVSLVSFAAGQALLLLLSPGLRQAVGELSGHARLPALPRRRLAVPTPRDTLPSPEASARLLARWLTDSSILAPVGGANGGLACRSGYDSWRCRHDFVYHEVTGYAASALVWYAGWTGEDRYRALADRTADYLAAQSEATHARRGFHAVSHSVGGGGSELEAYHAFDNAMVAQGLLAAYEASGRPRWLTASRAICDWLLTMQLPSGAFKSRIDEHGRDRHSSAGFADDDGVMHVKIAMALLKLYRATGEATYREAGERLLEWGAGLQDAQGAFWASSARRYIFSHAHAYACEGYLYAGRALGRQEWLELAGRGVRWLAEMQRRDGSLLFSYEDGLNRVEWCWRVSDATAQALRLWLLLGDEKALRDAATRAIGFLQSMQATATSDPCSLGGLYYSRWPVLVGGPRSRWLFAWPAMFALQAFSWAGGAPASDPHESLF